MKTSIGFRLGVVICAAALFIGAFSFLPVPVQADKVDEAAAAAADAVAKAKALAEECEKLKAKAKALGGGTAAAADTAATKAAQDATDAKNSAADEMKKVSAKETPADKAADAAATKADKAANAADDAMDNGDNSKDKGAATAETDADKADNKAGEADKDIDPLVKAKKQEARDKRKAARAARRKARALLRAEKKCEDAEAARKAAEDAIKAARDALSKKIGLDAKDTKGVGSELIHLTDCLELVAKWKELEDKAQDAEDAVSKAGKDATAADKLAAKTARKAADAARVEADRDCPPPKQHTIVPPGAEQRTETKTAEVPAQNKERAKTRKSYAEPDDAGVPASIKSANGLTVINFNTSAGRIVINLPDDMMAGDTISGTVFTEPKGKTPEEKAKNQDYLNGYVIELERTRVPANQPRFTWTPPLPMPNAPVRYQLKIVEVLPGPNPSDQPIASVVIFPPVPIHPSGAIITHGDSPTTPRFNIPSLGQTGRPVTITGPFDGDSSNTSLRLGGQDLLILAESRNQTVGQTPTNVVGATEIQVKEGKTETTNPFRNLKVELTAPKTSLLKGESTELHVEVNGLEGLTQPVPLQLTKGGVVNMEGGDVQTMSIKPSNVQNGTFTTTRTITGVQAGGWSATATVVVFDVCLQDDNNGNSLLFSRETGDYVVCILTGSTPMSLTTIDSGTNNLRVNNLGVKKPGVNDLPQPEYDLSTGRIYINSNPSFFPTQPRVQLELNPFTHTGTAIIETPKPKQKFTITDRDTRNNTCACR